MMRRIPDWLILPSLTAIIALGACSDELDLQPPGELVSSELSRDLAPGVPQANVEALAAGNTAFALDAYRELTASEDGNVFYSPLSISMAMAMTYGGARGETEAQMAEVLHYTLPQAQLHPAFNWLDLELSSRGRGAAGSDGKGFRLNIANATFGQVGYHFLPEYLDTLALNYGAGMSLLDFVEDTEGSRRLINDWVSRKTEKKIPELLPEGIIKPETRLVLTNAVYFNAAWKTPFDRSLTTSDTFHGLGGDVPVEMMGGMPKSMLYAAGSGYEAISLPYDGDELDMVIIMPEEGQLSAFEAEMDAGTLADIFAALRSNHPYGMLNMPKFEFRFKAELVDMFQSLGLTDAFDGRADFSGMDGSRSLQITAIVHEAFVNVNEAGTEAAAATGVVVGETSAPQPFVVNRPFLFLIRDIETGTILFLGRVLDPSA